MQIKVLIKDPGKPARVKLIENDANTFQEIVGGTLESLPLMYDVLLSHIPNICAFCDDSGKLKGKDPNFLIGNIFNGCYDVIVGPVVFAGVSGGDTVSLDDDQINLIRKSLTILG